MDATMMAYRLPDWHQSPRYEEVPVPRPAAGQILVKVAGNGLCHSDLVMTHMGPVPGWQVPFTLGHEIGGWVAALGSDVSGFSEGDPVVVLCASSDGTCPNCLRGHDNACVQNIAGRGYGRDGGMAPYVLVGRAQELIKLDSLDPLIAGPITDAGSTSYHAVKRVLPKLEPGSTAIVIGAGGLGALAVQYLKILSPTRVIVIDTSPARRAYAMELGADQCFETLDDRTIEAVRDLTQGYGADAVLDFVGIDQSIATGLMLTRWCGSFALVGAGDGVLRTPLLTTLPRDAEIFTFMGGSRSDTLAAITLAEQGKIRIDVELFTFSQAADAYGKMERGELRGRAVVQPGIWD